MSDPVAGWYPDPGGRSSLRYWNGHAWTQHVSPPVAPPEPDPAPQPPAPPMSAPVASGVAPAPLGSADGGPAMPPPLTPSSPQTPFPTGPPPSLAFPPPASVAAGDRLGPDGQVLSGWWRRVLGYLIDSFVLTAIALVILAIVGAVTGGFGTLIDGEAWSELLAKSEANPGYQPSEAELQALFGDGLVPFFAWLSVVTLALGLGNGVVLVARTGQTIGDRVVGTRKVLAGRRVPGFGPALLRWLIPAALAAMQVIPLLGVAALMVWVLDYLWPLWDPQRQALHDKAARTFVERSALAGPVNQ
jgi:uncharacterized RDD family membrane protein YckC